MLNPLAHGLRADANHPAVFPSEALADEKLGLTPPRSVRVTICVKPILLGHQRKVYFAYLGEVIIECLWLLRGVAVGEYKLISLRRYALRSSGEINNLVLVLRLSCNATLLICIEHRGLCTKIEWNVITNGAPWWHFNYGIKPSLL